MWFGYVTYFVGRTHYIAQLRITRLEYITILRIVSKMEAVDMNLEHTVLAPIIQELGQDCHGDMEGDDGSLSRSSMDFPCLSTGQKLFLNRLFGSYLFLSSVSRLQFLP